MSIPDAIPSRDDVVVFPDGLREILRQTAERRLREACDLAFPADGRDAVIEAVHAIDAFAGEHVTIDIVLALVPAAIEWQLSEARPPTTAEALVQNERALAACRQLVEFRDRLGGAEGRSTAQGGGR